MPTSSWSLDASRLESVACPVCHSVSFERLATTDRYAMGLVTVGCRACGLVMTNPQPTAQALDDFYSHHYRHFYRDVGPQNGEPTEHHIHSAHIDNRCGLTAALLAARGELLPGMVVLDLGAAEGSMLNAVKIEVPNSRRIGIEPNAAFGRFATTYAGCEWHASLPDFCATRPPPIDLVIINQVLEHLKNPVQVLATLRPLLAPGARVYIEVPDLLAYRKLKVLHIAHLYHFSADSLVRLAGTAGFEVCMIETCRPAKLPRSLRCVLSVSARVQEEGAVGHHLEPADLRIGWDNIKACTRYAWFAHGKRWLRRVIASRSGREGC